MKTTSFMCLKDHDQNVILEDQNESQYPLQKLRTIGKKEKINTNFLCIETGNSSKNEHKLKMSPGAQSDFSLSIIESDQLLESANQISGGCEKMGVLSPQDYLTSSKKEEITEKFEQFVKNDHHKEKIKHKYIYSNDFNHDTRGSKPSKGKNLVMMVKQMNRMMCLEDNNMMPNII